MQISEKISDRIKKLYPLECSVINPELQHLQLVFEPSAEKYRAEAEAALRRFSIIQDSSARLSCSVSCENGLLRLNCPDCSYVFPKYPEQQMCLSPEGALIWLILILCGGSGKSGMGERCLAKLQQYPADVYEIRVREYSIVQQSIAEEIFRNVQLQHEPAADGGADEFFERLKKAPRRYAARAPILSNRPVSEAVYESWNGGLIKKKAKNKELAVLACELYGFKNPDALINAADGMIEDYCSFIEKSSEFQRRLEKAKAALKNYIGMLSCASTNTVINQLRQKAAQIRRDDDWDTDEFMSAFEGRADSFRLGPEELKAAFKDVDSIMMNRSLERLNELFFSSLLSDSNIHELNQLQNDAMCTIGMIYDDMHSFCKIEPATVPQGDITIGWQRLSELSDDDLESCVSRWQWDIDSFINLQHNTQSCSAWLCPQQLFNMPAAANRLPEYIKCFPIKSDMTGVWAIWSGPYSGGENNADT